MSCVRKEKYSQISLTEEKHTYDEADRLIDTGVEYEAFGNQTKIPAADAGEHEITASFHVDNQLTVQTQNGETTDYTYDPAGRTEKTVSEGTTKAIVVNHYAGPVTVKLHLTKGEVAFLKKHHAKRLKAKIHLTFAPKKGAKLKTSVTVFIG
jgi:YD repeat-containing protein